jgi:hypothetical protein
VLSLSLLYDPHRPYTEQPIILTSESDPFRLQIGVYSIPDSYYQRQTSLAPAHQLSVCLLDIPNVTGYHLDGCPRPTICTSISAAAPAFLLAFVLCVWCRCPRFRYQAYYALVDAISGWSSHSASRPLARMYRPGVNRTLSKDPSGLVSSHRSFGCTNPVQDVSQELVSRCESATRNERFAGEQGRRLR